MVNNTLWVILSANVYIDISIHLQLPIFTDWIIWFVHYYLAAVRSEFVFLSFHIFIFNSRMFNNLYWFPWLSIVIAGCVCSSNGEWSNDHLFENTLIGYFCSVTSFCCCYPGNFCPSISKVHCFSSSLWNDRTKKESICVAIHMLYRKIALFIRRFVIDDRQGRLSPWKNTLRDKTICRCSYEIQAPSQRLLVFTQV